VEEEPLVVGAPGRRLEARLARPADARAGAVLCHPHPQYGGTMDDGVVVAVAGALASAGWATLRFNFGGVGASTGGFSGGAGEVGDVRLALGALAERLPAGGLLALVGYSFGAWAALRAAVDSPWRVRHVVAVGPPLAFLDWDFLAGLAVPVTFVVGDRDQFCPPSRLREVLGTEKVSIAHRPIPGADHFFGGRTDAVAAAAADVLGTLA
jgi:hypothetical protein